MSLRVLLPAVLLVTACNAPGPGREDRVASPEPGTAGPTAATAPAPTSGARGPDEPEIRAARGRGPDYLEFGLPDDRVIASVGDEELRKSQAFDYLLRTYPDKVRAAVAVMLGNRVLGAECDRFGIRVAEGEIDRWWKEHLADLERRARLELGADGTVEAWLASGYGQSLEDYRAATRDRERAKRLLSRLIRFHQIRSDRVELRIISVTDRDAANRVMAALAEGADFAALARRYSVHPSAENGGRMPPVWRGVLHPELDRLAFSLEEGATGGPVHVRDGSARDRFQVVRVLRRLAGRPVSWGEAEPEVLAWLDREDLTPDEWYMWQIRVERQVEIRLAGL